MISKPMLRAELNRKISNRPIYTYFDGKPHYHMGDYSTKSTANEVAKMIREISAANIALGRRGYLVRVSNAYFSDIDDKLKYGVYATRKGME